jgi:hypothetical protein
MLLFQIHGLDEGDFNFEGFLTSRGLIPYFHVSMICTIPPDVYDDAQPYIQFSKVVVDVFSPLGTRRCKFSIWRDCVSMGLHHGSVVDFLHGLFSLTFMCILSIHPVLGHLREGTMSHSHAAYCLPQSLDVLPHPIVTAMIVR